MQAEIFLPLPPRPATRPRFTCRGRFAVAYTDKPYREWLDKAADMLADTVMPTEWDKSSAFELHAQFQVLKPKTSKLSYPQPDTDNYVKGLMDAMTQAGHIWDDDKQVVSLTATKTFVDREDMVGINITLTPLSPEEI